MGQHRGEGAVVARQQGGGPLSSRVAAMRGPLSSSVATRGEAAVVTRRREGGGCCRRASPRGGGSCCLSLVDLVGYVGSGQFVVIIVACCSSDSWNMLCASRADYKMRFAPPPLFSSFSFSLPPPRLNFPHPHPRCPPPPSPKTPTLLPSLPLLLSVAAPSRTLPHPTFSSPLSPVARFKPPSHTSFFSLLPQYLTLILLLLHPSSLEPRWRVGSSEVFGEGGEGEFVEGGWVRWRSLVRARRVGLSKGGVVSSLLSFFFGLDKTWNHALDTHRTTYAEVVSNGTRGKTKLGGEVTDLEAFDKLRELRMMHVSDTLSLRYLSDDLVLLYGLTKEEIPQDRIEDHNGFYGVRKNVERVRLKDIENQVQNTKLGEVCYGKQLNTMEVEEMNLVLIIGTVDTIEGRPNKMVEDLKLGLVNPKEMVIINQGGIMKIGLMQHVELEEIIYMVDTNEVRSKSYAFDETHNNLSSKMIKGDIREKIKFFIEGMKQASVGKVIHKHGSKNSGSWIHGQEENYQRWILTKPQ
ncbi:hypothetical protein Fmac_026226 [Flemingia macrophylla]|uniref:Uncharacterized protein n=1 Tax=Flemingia macrophylla TaxID=520843 RepID=A0ABD1LEA3_9FABA